YRLQICRLTANNCLFCAMPMLLHCIEGQNPIFISEGLFSQVRFYLCPRLAVLFSPFGSSHDVPAREHLIRSHAVQAA
ncbi:MAG TPA: hypothetical protein PKD78_16980, partial [Saprospiraceae bacterium]|nr:hypothetical protein [Saprospiraceae bacterium]